MLNIRLMTQLCMSAYMFFITHPHMIPHEKNIVMAAPGVYVMLHAVMSEQNMHGVF